MSLKSGNEISRRQFIRDLSCSCIGTKIASSNINSLASIADNKKPGQMKYRVLGRTGLSISEVSLGGHYDGMGWRTKGSDKQRHRNEVFDEAIKNGINFFDSDAVYESKTMGIALSAVGAKREKIYLSVDTNAYKDKENYNNKTKMMDEIFKEVDEHLEALNTSYADVFRLTTVSMPFHKEGIRIAVEAFKVLKKQGKTRYFAISNHNPNDLFKMIDEIPEVDVLFIPYSYITKKAEKVFPVAKKKNIGVICIKPFVKGSLFKLKDIDLSKIDSSMKGRNEELSKKPEDLERSYIKDLAFANLKYILSNQYITTVIPGMETSREVRENVGASCDGTMTEQETGLLQDFWNNPRAEELIDEMCCGDYSFLKQWRNG